MTVNDSKASDPLWARISEEIAHKRRAKTLKHRVLAGGVAAVLIGGTTAGAFAVATAPVNQINYAVQCFGSLDMNADTQATVAYADGGSPLPDSNEVIPVAERIPVAEDLCAAGWRIGSYLPNHAWHVNHPATYEVPPLATCQLPNNQLGVFPSSRTPAELCPELGLTVPHDIDQ